MPECYRHGRYAGTRCPRCEAAEELERSRKQAEAVERESADRERRHQEQLEEAEHEARARHRRAEEAADYRARQLAAHQRELVENAHTIQAESLFERAEQLFDAGLLEEAVETSRDSIARDRAYLPAYGLLAASELDRGNEEAAEHALSKAVRLLGTAEWTDEDAYAQIAERLDGRKFSDRAVEEYRTKLLAFRGETTFTLLSWIASFGWSKEVVALLQAASLSVDDLLQLAKWLFEGSDPVAGAVLIGEAVRKLQPQRNIDLQVWLNVTHWAMDVEIKTGESASRLAAFDMAAKWAPELLLKAISQLPASQEWKLLPEVKARAVRAMLALIVAPTLNRLEAEQAERARASLPAPSAVLAWIPVVTVRDAEARRLAASRAVQSFREAKLAWIDSSSLGDLLILRAGWEAAAGSSEAVHSYLGEVEFWRAARLRDAKRYQEAADGFSKARDLCSKGAHVRSQQASAYWQGWCVHCLGGPWDVALQFFSEATDLAVEMDDPSEIGPGLYWQGMCLKEGRNPSRDPKRAKALFFSALTTTEAIASKSWVPAESHWRLAELAEEISQSQEALIHFNAARALYEAAGNEAYRADALRRIGRHSRLLMTSGSCTEAIGPIQQAMEIDRRLGNVKSQIADLYELGCCYQGDRSVVGDWTTALAALQEALALAVKTEDLTWQAKCMFQLGCSLEPSSNPAGDWQKAIDNHKRAAELARLAADDYWEVEALNAVGWCYQPINAPFGDWSVARGWCDRAVLAGRRSYHKRPLAEALFNLGKCMSAGDHRLVSSASAPVFQEAADLFAELRLEDRAREASEWTAIVT